MKEKKFVGLDGLKHFWTKIEAKVIKIIEDEIAQIIANAPEDLDTLKEIADWISTHEDSASAMNTAISTNTSDIATLKTTVAGKSDTGHTHTKSEITDFPTSLPANGGTADYAKRLKTFASWNDPFVNDATNGIRLFVFKITMPLYFNSILVQIYDDMDYAMSRKYILGLCHFKGIWGYNVSVTDLGGSLANGLRVWLGNDGNVYLQANICWDSRISFSHLEDITTDITIEKIGASKEGSNKDIDGNVLFTPLTDPIIDCGAIRASDLSSASKVEQYLKADVFTGKFQGDVTGNLTGTADKATSVVDYGDTSKTIQIGYVGAGATVDNLSHIAGYLTGGTQIKDVSKSVLQAWLGLSNYLPLSGGTVTGATQFNNYVKLNAWAGYGTGTANFWYDGNNKFVEIQNATDLKLSGVNVSKEGHTHTKSEITDFPTSLPANGGTADSANNGFNSSTTTDSTPGWGYLTSDNGYSNGRTYGFANGGGIATAEKDTKSSLQVDGDLYVHEGLDKVATLNDIPTSLPANGGTASSCSGNSATATQLQTARTINIQDSSATYTGTGASFNGSGDATIKLPSTIKANEFKIGNGQQSIAYRSKSFNGYKMHEVQDNALYIEGRELNTGDSGGLAITNDSVTVFGAGDTNGVFRVVNEDKAGDGSETAPAIFNIFKDGNVTMTGRLTAPSATIGSRPVITGTYSASDGILSLYTN